jgi:CHAD domain-containing protein
MPRPTPIPGLGPDTPRTTGLRKIIQARLADLLCLCAPLAAPPGPLSEEAAADAVHDARVASRRLRAALSLCAFAPRPLRRQVRDEVAALGRVLGGVRDLDVIAAWLKDRLPGAGPGEAPGLAALLRWLDARRAQAGAALDGALAAFLAEGQARVGACAQALDAGRGRMGGRALRRRLRKEVADAARWLERVRDRDGRPDLAHELRIALKKLRYHAEILAPALPEAGALLAALPPLQEALGRLHDADARVVFLHDRLCDMGPAERPALAWLLTESLHERRRLFAEAAPVLAEKTLAVC